jgi:predicted ester cyclase
MGIAATGKHLSLRGTTTLRVFGGKIIEEYGDWDALAYLQQVGAIPQSTEANKVLARRYIEDFLNNRDWAVADEILAEDYVGRGPHMPDICGPKAMKQFHIGLQASFPDRHFTVVQLIAEVDKVVVRWESVGTRTGEWMGVAPTGKSVRWSGVDTLRIAGGKVVEEWAEIDFLGFFQQVGIAPLVGEIKSPPTGQPDQKDIGRESAFQAAKAAFSLYGGFFKDVSQEIGMEKAESLHTKQGEFFGAKLAEITKKRLADKDFDMKTFASVLSDSYQIFGFTYGIEESAASLRLSCSRCPVYEGFKSAGLDHATVELLCNRMAAVELDEEKKLCPILSASLKFRATPDEACVEKFALAK